MAGNTHSETKEKFISKYTYGDLFTFFGIIFSLTWIGMVITAMITQNNLWKYSNRYNAIEEYGCVNFTIN